MKTREKIQKEALMALEKVNYNGCVVLSTGTGKTKVAIDAMKKLKPQNVLITSPRTNLKKNWKDELLKWNIREDDLNPGIYYYPKDDKEGLVPVSITFENIQTCYKWTKKELLDYMDKMLLAIATHCTECCYCKCISPFECENKKCSLKLIMDGIEQD